MYEVSLILDPGTKLEYCETRDWEAEAVAYAKNALLRTIETYGTPRVAADPQSGQAGRGAASSKKDINAVWTHKRKRPGGEKGSELERYLAMPTVDTDVDVLEWWKQHARAFPGLARIARDYLAIPATSAPAERVFSRGADLITKKRGSLNEDTIRACLCLKSWWS
jgi:hypothetical protein